MTDIDRLTRVRIGVRAVLGLGIAASIAANVLHAQDNPIARIISAWPPGALFITVEVVSRVPVQTRTLSWARVGAAGVIAGIAAWVSYWHMVAVALRYGESGDSAHLLPLSVDGLVVVASICLFELGTRMRAGQVAPASGRRGFVESKVYRWGLAVAQLLTFADLRAWIGRRRSEAPLPVAPTGISGAASTGTPTPDPTEAPSLVSVGSGHHPTPTGAQALPAPAVTDLDAATVRQLCRDIRAGQLKANPGAVAIRKHLGCGSDRARRLRDLLVAETEAQEAARA